VTKYTTGVIKKIAVKSARLMTEETRQSRNIKIKPSILRKAHHRAIESRKKLGAWIEEAIEEKAAREEREEKQPK